MQNQARAVRLVTIGLVVLVASMFAYFAWVLISPIDLPFQRVDRSMQHRTVNSTGTNSCFGSPGES